MNWLEPLMKLFRSNTLEEIKVLLAEMKLQKTEQKAEIVSLQNTILRQNTRIEQLETKLVVLEEMELECLQDNVKNLLQIRDLREELLVVTKWMNRKDTEKPA